MRIDKFGRRIVIRIVPCKHSVYHPNREILMHFKVKMWRIEAMRIPDCPDLLAASDLLAFSHQDSIQVSVQRISILYLAFLHKGMPDDNYISPSAPKIPGQGDNSIAGRINRIAKSCSTSPLPNPVFPKMAVRREASGDPIPVCVRSSDRKIKAVRESCQGCIWVGKRRRRN